MRAADHILAFEELDSGPPYYNTTAGLYHTIASSQHKATYSFHYQDRRNAVLQALAIFALRPNLEYATKLQDILQQIVPTGLQPDRVFGLPIRGTSVQVDARVTMASRCPQIDPLPHACFPTTP